MAQKLPFQPERLLCPGPTPVLEQVRLQSIRQPVYHRTESFYSLFLKCRNSLNLLMNGILPPIILTSSGTGAMESCILHLSEPNDKVLVICGGKFGERWLNLAQTYSCDVLRYDVEWGSCPDPDHLKSILKTHKNIKSVLFQADETSTGVTYPVEELAKTIREHSEAFVIVDAISGLGACPLKMDDWGIDAIVAASQKGLGTPPGLSFVNLSERALKLNKKRPKYYFDLHREHELQTEGKTAWTPAVGLIYMLTEALDKIIELGVHEFYLHHKRLAVSVRDAVTHTGFELFAKNFPSNVLTSIKIPESVDGKKLLSTLRKSYGAIFAGGQDRLSGKIIRMAHVGLIDPLSVMNGLTLLEFSLADLKYNFDIGNMSKRFMVKYYEQLNHN